MRQRLKLGASLAFLLLLAAWALPVRSDAPKATRPPTPYVPPRGYVCYRASAPVQIDGRVEEAAWNAVPWTENFVDIEGDRKPRPRFRTRAKMLWDAEYFYVAAELEEPHVWATLTTHDSIIYHDNDFEVFIDPDGDSHEYYEFEINALNTGFDLLLPRPYKDGGRALIGWDIAGLKTAVHVQGTLNNPRDRDVGWSVELAFPWKVLREQAGRPTPPKDGDQWRVNFSRVEWQHEVHEGRYRKLPKTREDNWVWSPQGVIDMHRPEKWGYVQFSTAAPGTAPFKPDRAGPARHLLHELYYAERAYRQSHGRWAETFAPLGFASLGGSDWLGTPTLGTTADLFQISVTIQDEAGARRRWHIRQDARIWSEAERSR